MALRPHVQGYTFNTVSDELNLAQRNGTVCKVVGRADASDGDLLEYGPSFTVLFGDGYRTVAFATELNPWYPT
jgi:hypothetical protein